MSNVEPFKSPKSRIATPANNDVELDKPGIERLKTIIEMRMGRHLVKYSREEARSLIVQTLANDENLVLIKKAAKTESLEAAQHLVISEVFKTIITHLGEQDTLNLNILASVMRGAVARTSARCRWAEVDANVFDANDIYERVNTTLSRDFLKTARQSQGRTV